MNQPHETAPPSPKHEAFFAENIFECGIGWVIAARFKANGQRVEVGIFCVDVGCLGVKKAFLEETIPEIYRSKILDHYASDHPMVPIAFCCARKLVDGAVRYAERLGFGPHPDYKKAHRVFGGIQVEDCLEEFIFGRDGKPFYMRGPSETEARAKQIVLQLQKRCGEGNYHSVVPLGTVDELNRLFET